MLFKTHLSLVFLSFFVICWLCSVTSYLPKCHVLLSRFLQKANPLFFFSKQLFKSQPFDIVALPTFCISSIVFYLPLHTCTDVFSSGAYCSGFLPENNVFFSDLIGWPWPWKESQRPLLVLPERDSFLHCL